VVCGCDYYRRFTNPCGLVITLKNNTDGLYFYSELVNGSFIEGNPYLFTFSEQFNQSNFYDISMTCTLADGYIVTFGGDLSVITTGKNFDIDIDGGETLEMLRVLWTV